MNPTAPSPARNGNTGLPAQARPAAVPSRPVLQRQSSPQQLALDLRRR